MAPSDWGRQRYPGTRRQRRSRSYAHRGSAKPKDRGGIGGFVENLADDVDDAIVGIPAGLVATVRDPIKTAKEIGKSYAQTYGPLARGDFGGFASGIYEHPLGPLLDIATVFTLGAAGAAKGESDAGCCAVDDASLAAGARA